MGRTIWFLISLLMGACFLSQGLLGDEGDKSRQRIVFSPSGLTILAEKADSEEKRQKGLMGRRMLKDHEGMIFYFDETARHAFWMFHTHMPLAIAFVDEDKVVVDVQFMAPCRSQKPQNCPIYVSRRPSRFAIEINQDVAKKYRIRRGDRIRFGKG